MRHVELCALWHIQMGEPHLTRQLEREDFTDSIFADLFVWIKQSVEEDSQGSMNAMAVQERFEKKYSGYQPYVWLEWITHAPYVGAGYQVVERLKRARAVHEANAFRADDRKPDALPDQFRETGRRLGELVAPSRLSTDDIVERIKRGVKTLLTGFPAMDYLCKGGIEEGGIFVIAARTGVGKTTMALNIVSKVLGSGKSVYFGSLEMPADRILQRLLQCFWGETAEQVRTHVDDMRSLPGDFIVDNPGFDLQRVLAGMTANLDADLFVIDYYQLIQLQSREGQTQKLEIISNKLKQFAFENRKPLIVLAQLNRQIETDRRNREPELSDLRGCGALEQDAHVVTFIWDKAAKDEDGKTIADRMRGPKKAFERDLKWLVKKNRNGEHGIINLEFTPEIMTFAESQLKDI